MHVTAAFRRTRTGRVRRHTFSTILAVALLAGVMPAAAGAQDADPRVGLGAGFLDAEQVASGMDLLGTFEKPDGPLFDPGSIGSFSFANSDLVFQGDYALHGNFNGFNIYDISDPQNPTLRTTVFCPGGQGDLSVYGDLLFMSVEETRGRIDCGSGGVTSANRFRGVRIFDISDIDNPALVAGVQTCRGSHTHRLVPDLDDPDHVYIYVNGTAGVRSGAELAGCANPGVTSPTFNETSSRFRIEVIKVPVNAPEEAAIVNEPRLFADDEGNINGLWPGGNHGSGTQSTSQTDACHDITVYPEIGLAAGACEGNGLLLDISDPANPQRIEAVIDPNFAYWHSANFNNDGTAVMFTDEWGGGTGARCRASDPLSWGANGLYEIVQTDDGPRLEFASHYKMPAVQTSQENCVAHQANPVAVPGRDIMVQGWYQGGISVFDWTDPYNPFEIAFFDRGPISPTSLVLGGYWSGYWYNGKVYGGEIARGLDIFDLTPTEFLTQNEIDAAQTLALDELNPMTQPRYVWDASFPVVRAFADQAARRGLSDDLLENITKFVDRAERFTSGPQATAAVAQLRALANQVDDETDETDLSAALRDLADALG